ncbi:hypothetical protein NQ318_012476 [Aromia moschata]|uniref:Transposase n=1 Tax=Aromia moschata TaxID=1265417 RepID=A0AAV8X2H2_9CUCU|nr:hypothetical protein NQ318_012476 [Aromia moschata]
MKILKKSEKMDVALDQFPLLLDTQNLKNYVVVQLYPSVYFKECFIQNGYNSEAASEAYFNRYPERRQPNMSIFGRLKENLVEYGGFNKPRPKNYRIQDAEDVAINVVGMVVVNPSISSRQIEAESGISRRRALSVLKKHKFRPYTIRKQQQLLPTDPERRLDFCNWYLQQIEQDQLFFKNIIWTDESYVSSAGIFNRHNKHYWSEDNPHQTVDVQNQGRFGFSVWCALYNNRILAYQLYDDNLNGQRNLLFLQRKNKEHLHPVLVHSLGWEFSGDENVFPLEFTRGKPFLKYSTDDRLVLVDERGIYVAVADL